MSPATIVEGKSKIDLSQKRLPFGAYAQVWIGTQNNMTQRAVPGIALKASNSKGGFYFMSLYTGKRINSYVWDELPISDEVIERIEEIAETQKQQKVEDGIPTFEWSSMNTEDQNTVNDGESENNDNDEESEDSDKNNENNDDEDINNQEENQNQVTDEEEESNNDDESMGLEEIQEYEEHEQEEDNHDDDTEVTVNENEEIEIAASDLNVATEANEENSLTIGEQENENTDSINFKDAENNQEKGSIMEEGVRQSARIKQGVENPSRFKNAEITGRYTQAVQLLIKKEDNKQQKYLENYMKVTVDVMFTQMSAKRGIKLFKERAVAAMVKELTQLDRGAVEGKPVVIPIDSKLLLPEEKRKALEAVHLITEKRSGSIKERTCANGSKQRQYLKYGETVASPTVSMEAMFLTFLIVAHGGREVVSFDIPGAFLQGEMSEDKLLLLKF